MKRHTTWALLGLTCLGAGLTFGACSADPDPATTSTGGNPSGTGGSGTSTSGTTGNGTGGEPNITVGTGTGGGMACDPGTTTDDADGDGFSEMDGDCNDCDEFVNPDAVEVLAEPTEAGTPEPVDEDCDGTKDNLPTCDDSGLALDSSDPMDAAKAIGLCKWVTSAKWVLADGSPPPVDPTQLSKFHLGHGILPDLGPNNPAQQGSALLAVSSGTARRETDPGFVHRNFDKGYVGNSPPGFPKESPSCPSVTTGAPNDATGLELNIKAPSNAQGLSFDFDFFTYEWPQFICQTYNDFFLAYMTPYPNGQTDGNISFDALNNPISVNNAFLDICGCPGGAPCSVPPSAPVKTFDCAFGTTGVTGTDFDANDGYPGWTNGSSGWLRTTAPVSPGQEFTIRFVTYDSSDHFVDSTTLVDNWQWSAKPGTVGTVIKPPD